MDNLTLEQIEHWPMENIFELRDQLIEARVAILGELSKSQSQTKKSSLEERLETIQKNLEIVGERIEK